MDYKLQYLHIKYGGKVLSTWRVLVIRLQNQTRFMSVGAHFVHKCDFVLKKQNIQ